MHGCLPEHEISCDRSNALGQRSECEALNGLVGMMWWDCLYIASKEKAMLIFLIYLVFFS